MFSCLQTVLHKTPRSIFEYEFTGLMTVLWSYRSFYCCHSEFLLKRTLCVISRVYQLALSLDEGRTRGPGPKDVYLLVKENRYITHSKQGSSILALVCGWHLKEGSELGHLTDRSLCSRSCSVLAATVLLGPGRRYHLESCTL